MTPTVSLAQLVSEVENVAADVEAVACELLGGEEEKDIGGMCPHLETDSILSDAKAVDCDKVGRLSPETCFVNARTNIVLKC